MKGTKGIQTVEIESSTETESLMENIPRTMSDNAKENSSNVSVTSQEVSRQIKAVTDPLLEQLAGFWELMRDLENEQANRRQEETNSFRAASSLSGGGNRSATEPLFPVTERFISSFMLELVIQGFLLMITYHANECSKRHFICCDRRRLSDERMNCFKYLHTTHQ